MTEYYGDFAEDDTVNIPFNTFDSNDPSASVTITNLADADIKVHKDGGLTQATTDGATVIINFDSITGNHLITIDTSADAFYVTGSEYQVRIEGTTVDGATINAWIGAFSIERAGGVLALIKAGNLGANVTQWNGTNVATPTVAGVPEIDLTHYNGVAVTGTIINDDDIGLVYESVITSDSGLVLTMTTAFPYDDWVNLPCIIKDVSAGPGGSVVRTIVASDQANETLTIDASLPFTIEDGVDELRLFIVPATARALENYDGTKRSESSTDTNAILAVLPAALSAGGNIKSDVKEVNDVTIVGDGSGTPFNV